MEVPEININVFDAFWKSFFFKLWISKAGHLVTLDIRSTFVNYIETAHTSFWYMSKVRFFSWEMPCTWTYNAKLLSSKCKCISSNFPMLWCILISIAYKHKYLNTYSIYYGITILWQERTVYLSMYIYIMPTTDQYIIFQHTSYMWCNIKSIEHVIYTMVQKYNHVH